MATSKNLQLVDFFIPMLVMLFIVEQLRYALHPRAKWHKIFKKRSVDGLLWWCLSTLEIWQPVQPLYQSHCVIQLSAWSLEGTTCYFSLHIRLSKFGTRMQAYNVNCWHSCSSQLFYPFVLLSSTALEPVTIKFHSNHKNCFLIGVLRGEGKTILLLSKYIVLPTVQSGPLLLKPVSAFFPWWKSSPKLNRAAKLF